jgi:hypothetical protein
MTLNPAGLSAREALRQAHSVRVVTAGEEGFAAENLPVGVYGFTASPALASPLFAAPRYRNFEVHRRAAGEVVLLAFVAAHEAGRLAEEDGVVHITAFPDVEGDASTLVTIPYSRIVHHRQYSIRNAASIALEVRPAPQTTSV